MPPPNQLPPRGPQPAPRPKSTTWLYIAIPAAVVVLAAIVVAAVLVLPRLHAAHSTQDISAPPSDVGSGGIGGTGGTGGSGIPGGAVAGGGASGGGASGPLDQYATASAPATSADSVDGAGNTTSYQAGHLLDGDPTTAWRMDGDGTGAVLTFTLDTPHRITSLGLINGYAKTDPVTGEDRYSENRRITHVTWILGGQAIGETLSDGTPQLQAVSFPAITTSTIELRIDAVTEPGLPQYDRTVISDVLIAG